MLLVHADHTGDVGLFKEETPHQQERPRWGHAVIALKFLSSNAARIDIQIQFLERGAQAAVRFWLG